MVLNKESEHNLKSLQKENRRLLRAVEELSILNEISTAIASTMELEKIESLMVKKCIKHFTVEQTAVMLLKEKSGEKPFQTMIRQADHSGFQTPFRLNAQLTGWMLKNRQPLLVNDLKTDERFQIPPRDGIMIQSLLCAPLFLKGKMIGLIACFNKKNEEGFSDDDKRLLSIIAAQSAQVIENARLYEQEQMLNRIQEEHRLAAEIQNRLLPKSAPDIEGYDIAGVSYPAKAVGGDYFDFIPIDNKRLAFCVADISGKGIPAALLMSNLQATIRTETLLMPQPCECLNRTNSVLYQNTQANKFATLFYAVLDCKSHTIRYSNAGHNRPFLWRRNGEKQELTTAGMVLSMVEKGDYSEDKVSINSGDLLVIYSDGIIEAINENNEEYGEERLEEIAKHLKARNAREIVDKIIDNVNSFCGRQPQFDDMTLMVIKRK